VLKNQGKLKNYNDEEVIFKEGSYGDEMYVIESGNVEIFRARDGRNVKLARLGSDDFFGELSFFGNYPRSASAKSVGKSKIFVVNKDSFLKLINDNVVWNILNKLGERIRQNDDKIEELIISDQVRKDHLKTVIQRRNWT
jgi:CRP/FNR family cyclic AMP-dependent transcriptional regulator